MFKSFKGRMVHDTRKWKKNQSKRSQKCTASTLLYMDVLVDDNFQVNLCFDFPKIDVSHPSPWNFVFLSDH